MFAQEAFGACVPSDLLKEGLRKSRRGRSAGPMEEKTAEGFVLCIGPSHKETEELLSVRGGDRGFLDETAKERAESRGLKIGRLGEREGVCVSLFTSEPRAKPKEQKQDPKQGPSRIGGPAPKRETA